MGMQWLSYKGYMNINYDKVKADTEALLDVNNDGKLDYTGLQSVYGKLNDVLGEC